MNKLIISIILISLILLASSCTSKSIFMRSYKVGSGDYYLTTQNGDLLFDDPKILHKYRYDIRVRKLEYTNSTHCNNNPLIVIATVGLCLIPNREEGDNTLTLIHKEKGVVNVLERGYTYTMPGEMYETGKRLRGFETWRNQERFLQRIKQLESIAGVSILYASKIEPPPVPDPDATPSYAYRVNIYFPLLISQHNDLIDKDQIKENLEERFKQELNNLGITHYQITTIKHHRYRDNYVSKAILLHEHYNKLVTPPTNSEYQNYYDKYLKIDKYRADLFVIQLHCDQQCVDAIEERNPLDLLPSKISHTDFINEIKAVVEQAGGAFNPNFTLLEERVNLPPHYINDPKPYTLSGKIEIIEVPKPKVELKVHWIYDLNNALNHPYPEALRRGAPKN